MGTIKSRMAMHKSEVGILFEGATEEEIYNFFANEIDTKTMIEAAKLFDDVPNWELIAVNFFKFIIDKTDEYSIYAKRKILADLLRNAFYHGKKITLDWFSKPEDFSLILTHHGTTGDSHYDSLLETSYEQMKEVVKQFPAYKIATKQQKREKDLAASRHVKGAAQREKLAQYFEEVAAEIAGGTNPNWAKRKAYLAAVKNGHYDKTEAAFKGVFDTWQRENNTL